MWLLFLLHFILPVLAQLALPNPPLLPPNASSGAQVSAQAASPNTQWSSLLLDLIYFYDCQRSGNLSANNRVPWRNSSAENDGKDVGLDLSGGYYDAGDYIKATYPLSFTLMSVCWGAIDYGKGYDLANQTAYLDSMLRHGLDWLIKAHSAPSTLYVLVGDVNTDNAYWGGDKNLPTNRPSYAINDTMPGTDAAAGASAAFSACAALYSSKAFNGSYSSPPASLKNETYAQTLLTHAQQLYTFAANATGGQKTYQSSVPQVKASYGSSGFGDDLTLAALFLAWASGSAARYQDAQRYFQQFKLSGENRVFNWDSKAPGAYVLFAQIAQSPAGLGGNLSTWQAECERYFDAIVNNSGDAQLTNDGLLYYPGDSNDASLNPALNAAMLLSRYAPMASTPDKRAAYTKFAQSQVDYVLGKNSMSMPYVVGSNPNAPANPHSAMASGGSDIANIDTSPAQEAYVLYGAVVGGPDKRGRFFDIRSDWPETEVALDYNAPMLTLAAMHVMNDTKDPFYTSLQAGAYAKVRPSGRPCDAAISDGCASTTLPRRVMIALAVTLSVVGGVILGLLLWYIWLLMRK
ncbi:glycoside hydrolase family 9 protein [Mycena belliarum]|uniref:Endoglucanase n=1 Tax=Mycena belliarum TaxID=1033014 RepID=A0AAD6U8N2_9AGAR|nr:glycoside hydrolase family 9 protein [Mycena belliae]